MTDQYLVEKPLQGDRDAFGAGYKNTEGLGCPDTLKMINNTEDRIDVAQDTYYSGVIPFYLVRVLQVCLKLCTLVY